jgi:hypothetical protein
MGPTIRLALAVLVAVALVGAILLWFRAASLHVRTGPGPQKLRRLADIPPEAWTRLQGKTIFFGHQSVGYNITTGLQGLGTGPTAPRLNIVETKDVSRIAGPMLAHAHVGKNRFPESKIAEFKELMENGLGEKVDVAFVKFCYVDLEKPADPEALLATYSKAMDSLKMRFPRVTFVHVTVPQCAPERGKKEAIKRLLGRSPELDDNLVRARYNQRLRERYSGKEPLLDLALYETLGAEGLRHYCRWRGQEVPVLVPAYTEDGGHLNAIGQRHVAEQLLIDLLDLAGGPR